MAEAPSITVPVTTGRTPLCNEAAVEKINRGTLSVCSKEAY